MMSINKMLRNRKIIRKKTIKVVTIAKIDSLNKNSIRIATSKSKTNNKIQRTRVTRVTSLSRMTILV